MVKGTLSQTTVVWARVLLAVYLVLLGLVVLLPGDGHAANGVLMSMARVAATWGVPYELAFNMIEFGANVALFVPLGLLLPLAVGAVRARIFVFTVIFGFVLSLVIEFVQQFIPGRVSDARDLVSNTIGAAIGAAIVTKAIWRAPAHR